MKRVFFCLFLILSSALPVQGESFWSQNVARSVLSRIFEDIEVKGVDEGVIERLEEFVDTYPGADVTDEALLKLGDIYTERKHFDRAFKAYQSLVRDFPSSPFKAEALYGLGYCLYRYGRLKDAREALEAVLSSHLSTLELKVKTELLLKEIDSITSLYKSGDEDGVGIGVVLSLKGEYARFADNTLKGILLAADVFGEEREKKAEVYVRNIEPSGESIRMAVDEIWSNPKVAGIVGPLLSLVAMDTAREAQQRGIPIITLSQRDGVPQVGEYVFRNFLTPRQQARTIVEYAFKVLENKRFAVLYPRNAYGTELAKRFIDEVTSRGGSIVREISYKEGKKDFGEELKYLFGIEVVERREGRRTIREYTPTVEVDAIFIPDYYDTISIIAPYLDYYNIKDVLLLGSNGWNSPRLVQLAGKYVEGAVFVDGFFVNSQRPATKRFVERFRKVYGEDPGILEAQAFDAVMMLISAIEEYDNTPDREMVRYRLAQIWGFEGATGDIYFDFNGDAIKDLFLLTVKEGKIVEIGRDDL